MYRVQFLSHKHAYQPALRHANTRIWHDICRPVSRLSTAETLMQRFKVDNKNAICRVHSVKRVMKTFPMPAVPFRYSPGDVSRRL